jgi:hypothetical protein
LTAVKTLGAAICRSDSAYRPEDLFATGCRRISMRKLMKLALAGVAAAAVAGSAMAASADKHMMNVALPNGGTAHIEYYGDVAPKVTIAPGEFAPFATGWAPMALPGFGNLDQAIARMNAAQAAMMKQVRHMTRDGGTKVAPINVVSYGDIPAGANSVRVVSVSNGSGTCTRTTQVTSQGAGKAPKVVSNVSGDCASAPEAKSSSGPVNRT